MLCFVVESSVFEENGLPEHATRGGYGYLLNTAVVIVFVLFFWSLLIFLVCRSI
jgi:hypothetical protein